VNIHIVLLPTVLSELDYLKVDGKKTEEVRQKAKKLSNMIKEYMRRGDLEDGVVILKSKVAIKSIAFEPDFKNTLSWLCSDNNDDRIIASFLEVIKQNSRSEVFLVTADVNLMNKLNYA